MLDAAPDAMVLADDAGTIVAVNREALRVFAYTREELIGASIETLVPERFRGRHPGHRAHYAADPRTRPMGAGLELWARRRDGSEFPAEVSLSRARHGDKSFTITAVRDALGEIRTNATRMSELIDALLSLSRLSPAATARPDFSPAEARPRHGPGDCR